MNISAQVLLKFRIMVSIYACVCVCVPLRKMIIKFIKIGRGPRITGVFEEHGELDVSIKSQ